MRTHTGTLIFVVQAALLVPYIIIGVIGGGTTLEVLSEERFPTGPEVLSWPLS